MGNEISKVTSPYEQKKANTKKKLEDKQAKQEAKTNAINVFKNITASIKVENYYTYNDYKKACEDTFNTAVREWQATEDTSDDLLTADQIKIAKQYMKSKEFKAAEKDIKFNNQNYVRGIVGNDEVVFGTNKGAVKNDVMAELKRQYTNGEITKEQYEACKKDVGTTRRFQRFFGRKEKVGDRMFETAGRRNNKDRIQNGMTSGDEGYIESKIKPELMAKLELAGYKADAESMQKLYEIYENNGGHSDGTIDYSYQKQMGGERAQLLAAMNQNLPEGAAEFTMNDIKDLGRALGYNVEKAVEVGKTFRDAGRGALIGLAGTPAHSSATATAIAADGATAVSKSVVPFGLAAPAVGAGLGAGISAYQQYHRVEEEAIDRTVPEGIKTYEDYAKHVDNFGKERPEEYGRMAKSIAKHFVNPYTNELDVEQMNNALALAAGIKGAEQTHGIVSTPLNPREAEALLTDLESGKIKPEFKKPVEHKPEPKPEPVYQAVNKPVQDKRDIETHDYTVKQWDDWNTVLRNKYTCADPKKVVRYFKDAYFNELKEKGQLPAGVHSSRDSFFFPVGYKWQLPDYIVIDGKRCYYQDNAVPQNSRSNGGATTINNNVTFQEDYERDNWNGYDITNGGNRQVAKDQPSYDATQTIIQNDAKTNYPGAEKVKIERVPAGV